MFFTSGTIDPYSSPKSTDGFLNFLFFSFFSSYISLDLWAVALSLATFISASYLAYLAFFFMLI